MGKLAIRGHATRGREVIKILEMLGGKNINNYNGTLNECYVIDYNKICTIYTSVAKNVGFVILTLEEFLDKFPYKVGDEVIAYAEGCLAHFTLQDIRWNNELNKIEYKICSSWCDVSLMQPYKEEPIDNFKENIKNIDDKIYTNISQLKLVNDMGKNVFGYNPDDIVFVDEINWVKITDKFWDSYKKEFFYNGVGLINQKVYDKISHKNIKSELLLPSFNVNNNNEHNSNDRNVNDICDDILINQITAKVAIINLKSDVCDDEVELNLGDYEIEIRDNKTYAVLKKPQYPKTYKECCEVLGIEEDLWFVYEDIDGKHINPACISNYRIRKLDLYHNLEKLKICRDAYWKLYGEKMGLGEPWEPDWSSCEDKFCITIFKNKQTFDESQYISRILAFPTEEMRDAFYENFKDLIEQCKELL